ncbi:MAG: hypothetical protein CMJ27_02650 [Phycisphaerae bacterium]|nr:hypothetical protein [Phycisphaerae bacterium]
MSVAPITLDRRRRCVGLSAPEAGRKSDEADVLLEEVVGEAEASSGDDGLDHDGGGKPPDGMVWNRPRLEQVPSTRALRWWISKTKRRR